MKESLAIKVDPIPLAFLPASTKYFTARRVETGTEHSARLFGFTGMLCPHFTSAE